MNTSNANAARTNENGTSYNVVASCLTYAGAKASSVKLPRRPSDDDDARSILMALPMTLPEGVNGRTAWGRSLTLVKWTYAGRQVLAERTE